MLGVSSSGFPIICLDCMSESGAAMISPYKTPLSVNLNAFGRAVTPTVASSKTYCSFQQSDAEKEVRIIVCFHENNDIVFPILGTNGAQPPLLM